MEKINLMESTRYAIEGRVVTMDVNSTVIPNGIIYIEGDTIVDIRKLTDNPPLGFTKKMIIKSGGTIYPGMIELHNHLSYNIIPTWMAPKKFLDRDQWRRDKDYRKLMTGPLKILGHIDGYLQAIVRFVECRLLFSGITSSQGITLASHQNIRKYYKGIVRNVEQTVDDDLPSALSRIADIKDAEKLLKRLERQKKTYLLHLAEGVNSHANKHFKALQISANKWAITRDLAGIHCVGLLPEDFEIMKRFEGSVIWSPMSNFLLYGITADIVSAKENGLLIGLGADWSASGSKNLLCELKVARLHSKELGGIFSDEELVRMVTTNASKILKWEEHLGSLEVGKKVDLIVIGGKRGDPYSKFIEAKEQNISWVIIDGIPRIGQKRLMKKFDINLEEVKLGSSKRYLYLANKSIENPIDIDISFNEAQKKLENGMNDLPQLAYQMEHSTAGIFGGVSSTQFPDTQWFIESEHEDSEDSSQRHHILYDDEVTGGSFLEVASTPLSQIMEPLKLDKATIANDRHYFKKLAVQKNLPEYIKLELPSFYGETIDLSDVESHINNLGTSIKSNFKSFQLLSKFYDTSGYLSLHDRRTIINQAIVLLDHAYVHLPLKKAMHASNPIEQLNIFKQEIEEDDYYLSEIEFHKRVINIFNSIRDLHTTYNLPAPFNDKVAFVPFSIEEYFEQNEAKYIVSKIIGKSPSIHFKKGVEITHWNNIPIKRAIKHNGDRYAGSNPDARFARGLDSMTFRPLAMMLAPEEERVTIHYITNDGKRQRITMPWIVGSIHDSIFTSQSESDEGKFCLSFGYDYLTKLIQNVKKHFFASSVVSVEKLLQKQRRFIHFSSAYEKTSFPGYFRATKVSHNGNSFGYIRIFSFATNEPKEFVKEFQRLVHVFSKEEGIILDVRGNGGGNILASEWMLQSLTDKHITPEPTQFINTHLIEELCRLHSPSTLLPELDLTTWHNSIKEIKQTGALYTLGYPITSAKSLKPYRAKNQPKLVLVTDALCYSATDIFVAGFQDHKLGKILGIHDHTGAGGANVWTHSLLYYLTHNAIETSKYLKPLPFGANFTIAMRRTLRVGSNAGIPLEDLGVKPDYTYKMTKDDLLKKNRDLISRACEILTAMQK